MRWASAIAAALVVGYFTCAIRVFLPPQQRQLIALKNRVAIPRQPDFDPAATLDALLAPGEDRDRWSPQRAAVVEGYVVRVVEAGVELSNCLSLTRRDIHLELALALDAPPADRLIAEVTPRMRDRLTTGEDWSTRALTRSLVGRRVRVSGWLMFDREHQGEAENTRPGRAANWRRTAWEIHPVTSIHLLP